jgi:hypothetical protein
MSNNGKHVPTWKIILAAILDFFTIFSGAGYVIASITGNTTESGFQLNGAPALILLGVVVAYFILMKKLAGGTIWQYILNARRN